MHETAACETNGLCVCDGAVVMEKTKTSAMAVLVQSKKRGFMLSSPRAAIVIHQIALLAESVDPQLLYTTPNPRFTAVQQ